MSSVAAEYLNYRDSGDGGPDEDLELPLLDIASVADATNNFSFQNKVGQGGFGEVYKVLFLAKVYRVVK